MCLREAFLFSYFSLLLNVCVHFSLLFFKCFFCKKTGHFKKDCVKRKEWFVKKGISALVICNESHLASVPNTS